MTNQKLLKVIRKSEGRNEEPSLVIINSQSVKTVEKSAPPRNANALPVLQSKTMGRSPRLRSPQRKDGASRGENRGLTATRGSKVANDMPSRASPWILEEWYLIALSVLPIRQMSKE